MNDNRSPPVPKKRIFLNISISVKGSFRINDALEFLQKIKDRFGINNASINFQHEGLVIYWNESIDLDQPDIEVEEKLKKLASEMHKASKMEEEIDKISQSAPYVIDYENNRIYCRYGGKRYSFPLSTVKEIFDAMPDEFTARALAKKARKFGLRMSSIKALALIRVFSHVMFNAEVDDSGSPIVVRKVKDGSVREENRKKLEIEGEVIGKPWEVEA